MTNVDIIGFIGVAILLFAYFLNLNNKLDKDNLSYLMMNFIGAGLACLASVLMHYMPFIILEGSWTIVSGIGILKHIRAK
ncbi:CBU_0592 family membrane protein [Flavobacterium nackdongense]|uniref:CBU-0592-like domain-containing protein n=1 Tax=Flavobacterium nackdongense TaxID=2547394 RepID=A0A4P6YDQ1_9FLAO|nr:hypothetical protein [Flavobacterium nackdongense]QBN18513.1 hypothetical protein E1750_06730 [Flavobacterium nackdongense]